MVRLRKCRRGGEAPQLCQIKNLEAALHRFADNEGMVGIDFNVSPC